MVNLMLSTPTFGRRSRCTNPATPPAEPRARKLGIEPSYKGDLPTRGSSLRGGSGSSSEGSPSPPSSRSTHLRPTYDIDNDKFNHALFTNKDTTKDTPNNKDCQKETATTDSVASTSPSTTNTEKVGEAPSQTNTNFGAGHFGTPSGTPTPKPKPAPLATPTRSTQRKSSLAEAGVKPLRLKSPLASGPPPRALTPKTSTSRASRVSTVSTPSTSKASSISGRTPSTRTTGGQSTKTAGGDSKRESTGTFTSTGPTRGLSTHSASSQFTSGGAPPDTTARRTRTSLTPSLTQAAEKPRVSPINPKKVPPRSSSITERSSSLPRVSRDALEVRKKLAEVEEKLRRSDARVTKLLAQQKTQMKSLPRTVVAEGDKDSMIASLQEKVADLELELENAEYCESTNHAETFMPMINDLQVQLTAARKDNERVREQLEEARTEARNVSTADEDDYKVPDLAQSEAIRYSNHVNEEELTARNFELEAQVNALETQVESLTSKLELQNLEHETAIAKQTFQHKEELERTELSLHARESEMSKLNLELESVQSRMSQLDKDLRRQQTQSLDLKMTLETKAMENDELRRSLIRVAEDTPELDKAINRRSIVMASPAMEGSKWQEKQF